MEEKKNSNKNIIIIVLIILVLALGGYIVYDKVVDKNNSKANNTEIVEKENDDIIKKHLDESSSKLNPINMDDLMDLDLGGYWAAFDENYNEVSYMDIIHNDYSAGNLGMGGPGWCVLKGVNRLQNGNYEALLTACRGSDDAFLWWFGDDKFEFKYDEKKKTITKYDELNNKVYYFIGYDEKDKEKLIELFYNTFNVIEIKKQLGITD